MTVHVAVVDYRSRGAAALVTESLRTVGFVILVNHPLDHELVRHAQQEWLVWFLSDDKWDYLPEPGGQDGYHPLSASETAVGADVPDLKEFFHWYPWGRTPQRPGEVAAALHRHAGALGAEVLGWIASQTPRQVTARFSVPLAEMLRGSERSLLRLLRYPPVTGREPAGSLRAAAHEDINLLTVLPAASHPGLQVLDRSGGWHEVACDEGAVVLNCGDMLQLASGGYYPSTTHRVVVPSTEDAGQSRMASPLFLQPADDVVLAEGVTAWDFLRERLRRIRGVDLTG